MRMQISRWIAAYCSYRVLRRVEGNPALVTFDFPKRLKTQSRNNHTSRDVEANFGWNRLPSLKTGLIPCRFSYMFVVFLYQVSLTLDIFGYSSVTFLFCGSLSFKSGYHDSWLLSNIVYCSKQGLFAGKNELLIGSPICLDPWNAIGRRATRNEFRKGQLKLPMPRVFPLGYKEATYRK